MTAPILVIDLEATCADDGSIPPELMEVIEVGAVWATPGGQILGRFQSFVRPLYRQQLTDFCRGLTHIEQASVDAAPHWPAVAAKLAEFAQRHQGPSSWWGSWGAFDRNQIERESKRHGIVDLLASLPHQNLKKAFAKARKIKQVGMVKALEICGLTLIGQHHIALDDSINIARLLPFCPRPDQTAEC